MNLTIVPAVPEDIPMLLAQNRQLIESWEDPAAIDLPRILAWEERKIYKYLHQYRRILLESRTVGYFRLNPGEGETELDDFYVLPEYRGRGIGTAVLDAILSKSKTPVTLCVFTANTGAVKLYRRFGFAVTEHISPTRCAMRREVP